MATATIKPLSSNARFYFGNEVTDVELLRVKGNNALLKAGKYSHWFHEGTDFTILDVK